MLLAAARSTFDDFRGRVTYQFWGGFELSFKLFLGVFVCSCLGRPGVDFGVILGYCWKVREMLLARATYTFGVFLGSVLGSVLELLLKLILTPVLESFGGRFGTHFGLLLGTFKLS